MVTLFKQITIWVREFVIYQLQYIALALLPIAKSLVYLLMCDSSDNN